MKKLFSVLEYKKEDINIYILLLSAPLLMSIYRYHGYADFFADYFPGLRAHPLLELYSHYWQFGLFFLLSYVFPVLFIKLKIKKPLRDFGFGFGDWPFGLRLVLFSVPLLVAPLIYIASLMPDVRAEYPLVKLLHTRHDLILQYELAYIFFYYIAWEFFFRGFLLFGLKERFGNMNAILIQTISSSLIHIGKPEGEIIGAIFLGFIFGALALRTRSIWYVFILHAFIGVLTDLFILFL